MNFISLVFQNKYQYKFVDWSYKQDFWMFENLCLEEEFFDLYQNCRLWLELIEKKWYVEKIPIFYLTFYPQKLNSQKAFFLFLKSFSRQKNIRCARVQDSAKAFEAFMLLNWFFPNFHQIMIPEAKSKLLLYKLNTLTFCCPKSFSQIKNTKTKRKRKNGFL